MGYEFDNSTQNISYGKHSQLYQAGDLSIGMWIYFIAGVSDNTRIVGQLDSFPCILCLTSTTPLGDGYGVQAEHIKGGSASFGVKCKPGAIDPIYKVNAGEWRYFGFSRSIAARTYYSYFGSRTALFDGQTFTWLVGQDPFPLSQPGQNLGFFQVGTEANGVIVGPAHYWDVELSREQHLSMARCTLPEGVSRTHLLWWSKMTLGAADVSDNMWPNTFSGSPLPTYVPDEGCASFDNGRHYRLYTTG